MAKRFVVDEELVYAAGKVRAKVAGHLTPPSRPTGRDRSAGQRRIEQRPRGADLRWSQHLADTLLDERDLFGRKQRVLGPEHLAGELVALVLLARVEVLVLLDQRKER